MSQLSSKLRGVNAVGQKGLTFMCPGCCQAHIVNIGTGGWVWNGSLNRPTFMPAVLVVGAGQRCHGFVTDGQIQFLPDSTHALAGKLVDLLDWERP